jgi:glycosidase
MHEVMRFWLDRGVDGFRIDVIWHLIKDEQFRAPTRRIRIIEQANGPTDNCWQRIRLIVRKCIRSSRGCEP